MKFSAIIALLTATIVLASPAAVSLNRSVKEIRAEDGTASVLACIECPCDGWTGDCRCVPQGCCCPP